MEGDVVYVADSDEDIASNPSPSTIGISSASGQDADLLEPWEEWIQRVTHEAEAQLQKMGMEDCITQARKQKWRWAAHMATMPSNRRAPLSNAWMPELTSGRAFRCVGHPRKRWSEGIAQIVKECCGDNVCWEVVAKDMVRWMDLEANYVSHS